MRRDQKLAKKKKARDQARAKARRGADFTPASAASKPFGPCWLSRAWRDDGLPPELVTAVLTRDLGGLFMAHVVLVDRTCLGVKNAMTIGPLTRGELADALERIGAAHVEGLEQVTAEEAQSVVFAAVAYAARLGFQPNDDFDARLIGPAPSPLRPTPLATLARPFYVAGPDDDQAWVLSTLRRATGERGFDVGDPNAIDFDDDGEQAEDEARLSDVLRSALADRTLAKENEVAFGQFLRALDVEDELPREHVTSLPGVWAALFRPRADGTRGIDGIHARRPEDPAVAALAETRAVLFEILAMQGTIAICRDVLNGDTLRVRLGVMAGKTTRWLRIFGYLTPMADGTWYGPSTLLGHAWLRHIPVEAWIAKLNDLLAALGVKERVDLAAPTRGLTRWGGLAHGVLHGMIAGAEPEEDRKERERPVYVVNSDGDLLELHEATIPLDPGVERRLLDALASADDFLRGPDRDAGLAWMREPTATRVVDGEHIALVDPLADNAIRVSASSKARFQAVLARLSALAEAALVPARVEVTRPWEHLPNAVAIETAESRRMIFGATRVDASAYDPHAYVIASMRKALDEEVPMLGGRPRDLVGEAGGPEGRARVERWLQGQETRGLPGAGAYLDLDVLRRELGLPVVLGVASG